MPELQYTTNRRRWLALSCAIGSAGLGLLPGMPTRAQTGPEGNARGILKLVAQKFHYTPDELVLKKGGAYVLEITTLDFAHGFFIPELKIRADLVPGSQVRVDLKIDREGVYEFICDNFCGSGHEEMAGKIVVIA